MTSQSHTRFPPGKSLSGELAAAMRRIENFGTTYPEGYYETLLDKYTREGVRYPHILMILGIPRINNHFFYERALRHEGTLLDYGCGTGDNVRRLIRDGFPQNRISAFDINWSSIDLGFDLYMDREKIRNLFSVSKSFPFENNAFNLVYSASVIHVICDDYELVEYLKNAYNALTPGGVFFGSTLGLKKGATRTSDKWGPPRVMPEDLLRKYITGAGFNIPKIVQRQHLPHYIDDINMGFFEFCTVKPAY